MLAPSGAAQPANKQAAAGEGASVVDVGATSPNGTTDAVIPDPVAVVEGVEISKAELENALRTVLARSRRTTDEIPQDQKSGAYRMVLDDLIVDKLISKRAANVEVSDEEVEIAFKRSTAEFGTAEQVRGQIEKSGQTVPKVKEEIRAMLRQQHWVESQLKAAHKVTDSEIKEFYDANPEHFKLPERVRASHILLALKPEATPSAVVEKEKEAQHVIARLTKGEDFEKVAQEVSEDPSAKQNGGDLDFFTREQMVAEFAEAAFKMKRDEVSAPVRTQFGYHIIKVTDRKGPGAVPLAEAKPQVMAYLKQQKKQAEVEKVVRAIREKAEVKINLPGTPVSTTRAASDPDKPQTRVP